MRARERNRRRLTYAGIGVGVLAVLNVAFLILVFQPARSEYRRVQEEADRLKIEQVRMTERADRLQSLRTQLAQSGGERRQLLTERFLERTTAFSRILPELDAMARTSKVQKSHVEYSVGDEPEFGLYPVRIAIPVEGDYRSVVDFIRQLESANTFYVLDSVDLRNSTTEAQPNMAGGPVTVSLGLNVSTYFVR